MKVDLTLQIALSNPTVFIPQSDAFQTWADTATQDLNGESSLCIRIVDESESQQLNRDFRQLDKPTNILSFDYELPTGVSEEERILGDIVMCPAIISKEAAEYGVPLEHHWAHLVIHGILHLMGYDHNQDDDAQAMQKKEIELLSQLDIHNPY